MIYFIYLAAGNSIRFGNENKLLHLLDGKPMFRHGLDALNEVVKEKGDSCLLVVTKHKEINEYAMKEGISVLFHNNMKREISDTIKHGLIEIGDVSHEDYYVFVVADQPMLEKETFENIIEVTKKGCLTACMHDGIRNGNPSVFSAKLRENLMKLNGDKGGSVLFKQYPPIKIQVRTNQELKDIDDIGCLEKLRIL